ncbi:MAG: aldose 1-epimerase, partial [Bryobacteraceae bacterium]
VFELLHRGLNWVYSPYASPAQMQGKHELFGIPLLAPWANRLSSDTYTVHGSEYTLNRKLGNLQFDQNRLAIHGLLAFVPWTAVDVHADANFAEAHSVLDFTKHPQWMAQFPFAHRLDWYHRLAGGRLTVRLTITNQSVEDMPLCIGFHPYFEIPRSGRDDWKVELPVSTHMLLSDKYIPTGETQAASFHGPTPLKGFPLDDVYSGLQRDAAGDAVFSVSDGQRTIQVAIGPEFPVAVVYAPFHRNFICFEPMTAPTDALHLAAAGLYPDLRYIKPDKPWTGEFWVQVG